MEFLEREPFLARFDAIFDEVVTGTGRLALVSGEAGIGKTTLVDVFTRKHRYRARLLWGACDLLFTPRPLGPLHDVAAQIETNLQELLHSDANRAVLFSAFLAELNRKLSIIVFEDIHWADEATLDLLRYLGRRIAQTKSLLILTYRDDELDSSHPLRVLLGDLAASVAVRRFQLPPLSEEAVRTLVGERPMDVSALYRQTAGNPFFVTEILANSGNGIPPTVRDAILARAARLSPQGHAVLEAASVITPRIEPWLLDMVSNAPISAVEECFAAGLLKVQGDILTFRHELERQTILETISPLQKQKLHRLILQALNQHPVTRHDMARLAHHAEAAGEAQAVLEFAPIAAQQAAGASAHREAAALYALTVRYIGSLPLLDQVRILRAYAQECHAIDNRFLGIEVLRKAYDLCRQTEDSLQTGAILAQMGNMLIGLGQDVEAMQSSKQAIEILETLPPSKELAYAYWVQAGNDMINRNLLDAVAWAEKGIRLAEQLADTDAYYSSQTMLGSALISLDYERGCRHMESLIEPADAAGRKTVVALIYANLGSGSSELYHFSHAEQYLRDGLAYTIKHDIDRLRYYMLAWLAFTQLRLGNWNEAADIAEIVVKDANVSVTSRMTALVTLGRLRARLGDPQAFTLLDEASELSRHMGSLDRLGLVSAARAEAAWLAGDLERARVETDLAYPLAFDKQHPWFTGELAWMRQKAGELQNVPEWTARPYALQIAGDWRSAAAEWERLGCPYEQADALRDGDTQSQVIALAIFERLGARPAADSLRQKLRGAGVYSLPRKPRSSTRENPFGLTSREVEILRLLMEGLSNAEIAARLHISPKTTDHHVSAVLAKLDVHSRETAADLARQHPQFRKI